MFIERHLIQEPHEWGNMQHVRHRTKDEWVLRADYKVTRCPFGFCFVNLSPDISPIRIGLVLYKEVGYVIMTGASWIGHVSNFSRLHNIVPVKTASIKYPQLIQLTVSQPVCRCTSSTSRVSSGWWSMRGQQKKKRCLLSMDLWVFSQM